jgi:hypothetical protein
MNTSGCSKKQFRRNFVRFLGVLGIFIEVKKKNKLEISRIVRVFLTIPFFASVVSE